MNMTSEQQLVQDPEHFIAHRQKLINALVGLWSSSIPDHLPTEQNFSGWLDTFGPEVAAAAIKRTANKARTRQREHAPMGASELEKYATGCMKVMGRAAGYRPRTLCADYPRN
jgi:hypothetical protein